MGWVQLVYNPSITFIYSGVYILIAFSDVEGLLDFLFEPFSLDRKWVYEDGGHMLH